MALSPEITCAEATRQEIIVTNLSGVPGFINLIPHTPSVRRRRVVQNGSVTGSNDRGNDEITQMLGVPGFIDLVPHAHTDNL